MADAEITPLFKRPVVMTCTYPEDCREPLGSVAVESDLDLNFPAAFEDVSEKLIKLALLRHPHARILTNLVLTKTTLGYHHHYYLATADIYGDVYADY